jgi:hypothetical protein
MKPRYLDRVLHRYLLELLREHGPCSAQDLCKVVNLRDLNRLAFEELGPPRSYAGGAWFRKRFASRELALVLARMRARGLVDYREKPNLWMVKGCC